MLGIAVVIGVAVAASFASAADFGTATLRVGSRGAAVMEVQKLVGVTADGAYGPMTEAAVKAWQANVGLYADGIFGPASRAKAYELAGSTGAVTPTLCLNGMTFASNCTVAPGATTPTPVAPVVTSDEEADLSFDVDAESDIDQNGINQHAFTIEIEADEDGGDALIERLDLKFKTTGATTYRSISRVALEVDGDEIAEADTDSRSDWRGKTDTIRFSDLNLVVKSGKIVEVEVLLDVTDDVDNIELLEVGYRYSDGTGLIVSDEHDSTGADISVTAADAVNFRITENRSNPSDTSLDVSSSRSNETLAIVDVEVRKGEGALDNVEVTLTFDAAVTEANMQDLLSRVSLEIDGKQVDYINSSSFDVSGSSNSLVLVFDADEFDFEEDDEFEIEVLASFRAYNKTTIKTVKVTNIALIGYDDGKGEAFPDVDKSTSFAPTFTLTQGDILVAISDVEVRKTDDHKGTIVFDLEVENDRGTDLQLGDGSSAGIDVSKFVFDVKGYGIATSPATTIDLDTGVLTGTPASLLADGDIATFEVTLNYDSTSTKAFTIEVKEIGGVALGYIWAD
ncbi:MAG: peptidoglycan-binding domain-containing protein [Clostridia bacterium]|nr:peptidoglycan-binding domain-containing protein [Clostridia bacterium]